MNDPKRSASGAHDLPLALCAIALLAIGGQACVRSTAGRTPRSPGSSRIDSGNAHAAFPGFAFSNGSVLKWGASLEALTGNVQPPKDTWDHYCGSVSEARWIRVCYVEAPLIPEPYSLATIHFNENRLYESFLAFPAGEVARVRRSVEERIGKPSEEREEAFKPRVGAAPIKVTVTRWKGEFITLELRSQGLSPGQGRLAITYLPMAPSVEAESPL
jgi:hypothetical protein